MNRYGWSIDFIVETEGEGGERKIREERKEEKESREEG